MHASVCEDINRSACGLMMNWMHDKLIVARAWVVVVTHIYA